MKFTINEIYRTDACLREYKHICTKVYELLNAPLAKIPDLFNSEKKLKLHF